MHWPITIDADSPYYGLLIVHVHNIVDIALYGRFWLIMHHAMLF